MTRPSLCDQAGLLVSSDRGRAGSIPRRSHWETRLRNSGRSSLLETGGDHYTRCEGRRPGLYAGVKGCQQRCGC